MTTMCKLVTLFTIDKIFEERTQKKISWSAQMLYINCLMKRFKGLPATIRNSQEFELWFSDMKNPEKWESSFRQLHEAKLVTIQPYFVLFHNMWGQYIDRKELDQETQEKQSSILTDDMIKKYFSENQSLVEIVCMKNRIQPEHIPGLVKIFLTEQRAVKKVYYEESEVSRHFMFWVTTHIQYNGKPGQNSNGPKILGINNGNPTT